MLRRTILLTINKGSITHVSHNKTVLPTSDKVVTCLQSLDEEQYLLEKKLRIFSTQLHFDLGSSLITLLQEDSQTPSVSFVQREFSDGSRSVRQYLLNPFSF